MPDAVIVDAVRTPVGRRGGALAGIHPGDLTAHVLNALTARTGLDPALVDDVVWGCVSQVGDQAGSIGRVGVLAAGWPESIPATTVDRRCGSSQQAIHFAAAGVAAGHYDFAVAGGVESMSRVPMGSDGGAWVTDPATNFKTGFVPQGVSADLLATLEGFGRTEVDEFAAASHARAAEAREKGRYARSLIPVVDQNGLVLLDQDEAIRPQTTVEALARLKPAFEFFGDLGFDAVAIDRYPQVERIHHVHTAGNSSQIVDGAAAMLIGNERAGRALGLTPRARIVATATLGVEPTLMLAGPAPATRKALDRAGLSLDDIDLFEVNEAFSAVVLKFQRALGVGADRVNVAGGAIALGHPLGATGCMLLGTLLDELEQRNLQRGVATLCVGAGMGVATIIERV
jgi:acetyl-CoA C-acetyltransferase